MLCKANGRAHGLADALALRAATGRDRRLRQSPQVFAFCTVCIALLASAAVTLDVLLPLGVVAGVLHIPIVLIGSWLYGRRSCYALAAASSVLLLLGYFLSPPGAVDWIVWVNRAFSLFGIWATAIFIRSST